MCRGKWDEGGFLPRPPAQTKCAYIYIKTVKIEIKTKTNTKMSHIFTLVSQLRQPFIFTTTVRMMLNKV